MADYQFKREINLRFGAKEERLQCYTSILSLVVFVHASQWIMGNSMTAISSKLEYQWRINMEMVARGFCFSS